MKRSIEVTPERWLSVDEIAVHLGISKETIYRRLEASQIPAHKIGKLWKFKVSEVDEWVKRGGATTSQQLDTQGPTANGRSAKKEHAR